VAGQALTAGAAFSIASGAFLIFSKPGRERRKEVANFQEKMTQIHNRFLQVTRTIVAGYLKRKSAFGRETTKFDREFENYEAEGDKLQEVIRLHRMTFKDDFLRKFLIRDHIQQIPGMTSSLVSMLESFGVESALDVDELTLTSVPVISSNMELELLQWRSQMEQKFVFKPDHGVTAQDLKGNEELATQRFKVMQSRKVLMAATRLKTQENIAKSELDRGLAKLDSVSSEWSKVAKALRDLQSGRRRLERSINRSLTTSVAIALGIPLVGLILHLIFR
jgi:DNA-binding helix-hairpin-helix protein with protein kinase domain